MTQWRVRDPATFPRSFHEAMAAGEGVDKLVSRRLTKYSIEVDRTQWNIFCFSLRHRPASPLHTNATQLKHRTRLHWNEQLLVWELLLTSRKSVLEDMEILP